MDVEGLTDVETMMVEADDLEKEREDAARSRGRGIATGVEMVLPQQWNRLVGARNFVVALSARGCEW